MTWLTTLALALTVGAGPPPPVVPQAPRHRGAGLTIGGSLVFASGMGLKLYASELAFRAARDRDRGEGTGESPGMVLFSHAFAYNPLLGGGIAMLASGFSRRGRWAADQALFRGGRVRAAPRPALGWALFGTGLGLWITSRFAAPLLCDSATCELHVWEGGFYTALAMTSIGLPLATWSMAYRQYHDSYAPLAARLAAARVAPFATRQSMGLSLSGRF